MSGYFFGRDKADILGDQPQYFYGLRRNDNGEITFGKINQLSRTDVLTINSPGDIANNYDQFEIGVDFYEGRNVYHAILYPNLNYEQYRWDDRSISYYIDSDGELVARINTQYSYPSGISS